MSTSARRRIANAKSTPQRRQPMTLDKNYLGGFDGLRAPISAAALRQFMNKPSFGDLFCETNKCSPEEFGEKVFWFCLYPQAIPLARLIRRLNRAYFRPDVEFI
jgi:hypothetical protein